MSTHNLEIDLTKKFTKMHNKKFEKDYYTKLSRNITNIVLESFGTLFAAVGFSLLSFGILYHGFILGVISCCFLIPLMIRKSLFLMFFLQLLFLVVNINGIFNNY